MSLALFDLFDVARAGLDIADPPVAAISKRRPCTTCGAWVLPLSGATRNSCGHAPYSVRKPTPAEALAQGFSEEQAEALALAALPYEVTA